MTKVCVLILNCNNKKYIEECINSYKKSSFKDIQIIVIDNNSTDGSLGLLHKITDIKILENTENLGYCGGFNLGIKYSIKHYNPEYIILSNPDLIVEKKTIAELYNGMEKDIKVGFGGALQLDYDTGEIQSYGGSWNKITGSFSTNKKKTPAENIEYAEGAFLMTRAAMLNKKGFWDERYFIYHEDIEIQYRYKKLGYKSKIYDSAIIKHRSHWNKERKPFQFYYMFRNRLLFIRENSNFFVFLYSLAIFFGFYLYSLIAAPKIAKSVISGISDFFKGKFGKNDSLAYKG